MGKRIKRTAAELAADDATKLSERVAFRMTKADKAAYESKVAASGLTPSEFFRSAVLTNKTAVISRRLDPRLVEMRFLMRKASNNINQIAHRVNADNVSGKLSDRTYLGIMNALIRLSDYMKLMVEK